MAGTRRGARVTMSRIEAILDGFLGDSGCTPESAEACRERWYRGGDAEDARIRSAFGADVERALRGDLDAWCTSAAGCLALVLLLDQCTRTIYRRTPRAFAGDPKAYAVACTAVACGHDRGMAVPARIFLYHPFHHSESLADQERGIDLLHTIPADVEACWHPYVQRSVQGFSRHRDIVARFGRYPHRNEVLGRPSSEAELAYLGGGAERFGQ
jgi:uncharacterized protein (DUF924 family)